MKSLFEDRWTLVGMFVAWVLLEGLVRDVVGWLIVGTIGLQLIVDFIDARKEKKK